MLTTEAGMERFRISHHFKATSVFARLRAVSLFPFPTLYPTLESMLFEVKKDLRSKIQHWFWGEGVGVHRGKGYMYVCPLCKKRSFYRSFSKLLSLIVVFPTTKLTLNTVINKTTLDTYLSSGIPSIFKADKHWWSLDVNQVNKTVCNCHDCR